MPVVVGEYLIISDKINKLPSEAVLLNAAEATISIVNKAAKKWMRAVDSYLEQNNLFRRVEMSSDSDYGRYLSDYFQKMFSREEDVQASCRLSQAIQNRPTFGQPPASDPMRLFFWQIQHPIYFHKRFSAGYSDKELGKMIRQSDEAYDRWSGVFSPELNADGLRAFAIQKLSRHGVIERDFYGQVVGPKSLVKLDEKLHQAYLAFSPLLDYPVPLLQTMGILSPSYHQLMTWAQDGEAVITDSYFQDAPISQTLSN